jgi:hypothetical protein
MIFLVPWPDLLPLSGTARGSCAGAQTKRRGSAESEPDGAIEMTPRDYGRVSFGWMAPREWTRTIDRTGNNRLLYQLSYRGIRTQSLQNYRKKLNVFHILGLSNR